MSPRGISGLLVAGLLFLLGLAKAPLVSGAALASPIVPGWCPVNSTIGRGPDGITARWSNSTAWGNATMTRPPGGWNRTAWGRTKTTSNTSDLDSFVLAPELPDPSVPAPTGFLGRLLDAIPPCAHDCIRHTMWSYGVWVDDNRFPHFCLKKKHENSWALTGPCIRDSCAVAARARGYAEAKALVETACDAWARAGPDERRRGAAVAAVLFPAAAASGAPSLAGALVAAGVGVVLVLGGV